MSGQEKTAVKSVLETLRRETNNAKEYMLEQAKKIKPSRWDPEQRTRLLKEATQDPAVYRRYALQLLQGLEALQVSITEWEEANIEEPTEPLGLADQKLVLTAIEFIILFGISPLFIDGTGVPISKRLRSDVSEMAQIIIDAYSNPQKTDASPAGDQEDHSAHMDLAEWVTRLAELAVAGNSTVTDVGLLLRTRYLADVIAGLFQAGYAPLPGPPDKLPPYAKLEDRNLQRTFELATIDEPRKMRLRRLFGRVFEKSDPFSAFEALSLLQSVSVNTKPHPGPVWYRRLCGRYMSHLVQRPHGVQVALNFMLNNDNQMTAKKLDHISQIILTPPASADRQAYIRNVCQTMLRIVELGTSPQEQEDRVSSAKDTPDGGISERHKRQYSAAVHILHSLFARDRAHFISNVGDELQGPLKDWYLYKDVPLLSPSGASQQSSNVGADTGEDKMTQLIPSFGSRPKIIPLELRDSTRADSGRMQERVVRTADQLRRCIVCLHSVIIDAIPSRQLVSELIAPIFVSLFHLYSILWQGRQQSAKTNTETELTAEMESKVSDLIIAFLERESQDKAIGAVKQLIYTVRETGDSEGALADQGAARQAQSVLTVHPIFELIARSDKGGRRGDVALCWPSNDTYQRAAQVLGDGLAEGSDPLQRKLNLDAFLDFFSQPERQEIAGHIFVSLLQDYTANWELYIEPPQAATNSTLVTVGLGMDAARRQNIGQWWLASQTLMSMVEQIGPRLLTQPIQILGALQVILERVVTNPPSSTTAAAAVSLDDGGDDSKCPSAQSIMDELTNLAGKAGVGASTDAHNTEEQIGDTETVLVALTLLSTLLSQSPKPSDTQTKWTFQALQLLSRVSENIEKISKIYARSPVIANLASEIRAQSRVFEILVSEYLRQQSGSAPGPDGKGSPEYAYNQAMQDLQDELVPVKAHGLLTLRQLVLDKSPLFERDPKKLDDVMTIFVMMIQNEDTFIYLNAIKGLASFVDAFGTRFLPKIVGMYENEDMQLNDRLRVGEAIVQIALRAGDALGKYAPELVPVLIRLIREDKQDQIHVSALAILGAMCQISPLALHRWLNPIIGCLRDILMLLDANELRRAAVAFLVSLIQGHGPKLFERVDQSVLAEIYDQLEESAKLDTDEIARDYALVGLEELEETVHDRVFGSATRSSRSARRGSNYLP